MKYFAILLSTFAATIQQILSRDSSLSTAAAVNDPLWSQPGPIAVLVATNSAIASASGSLGPASGTITFSKFLGLDSTYALISDKNNVYTLVWNNGSPGSSTTSPNIEIRNGLGSGSVTRVERADNGLLYISDNFALVPPTDFITTLNALQCTRFAALIESTGLSTFVNGLKGVTIFAPTDGGYATQASTIDGLTVTQQRAYVFNVILPQIIYTDNIKSGTYQTLLASNTIAISASNEGAMFPGSGHETNFIFSQADNFCANGVIQRLDFWLKPNTLPGPNAEVKPVGVPAGSAAFTPGPSTSGTAAPGTKDSKNSDLDRLPTWLAAFTAAFAMFA